MPSQERLEKFAAYLDRNKPKWEKLLERRLKNWCAKKDIVCVTQIAMHGYIVDFFFPQFNTAVELDGPLHDERRDAQRDAALLKNGVQVLRFKNPEDKVGLNAIYYRIYSEIRYQARRTRGGRKCQF